MCQLKSQWERNNGDSEEQGETGRPRKSGTGRTQVNQGYKGCLMVIIYMFYTQGCESHFMHFIFDN